MGLTGRVSVSGRSYLLRGSTRKRAHLAWTWAVKGVIYLLLFDGIISDDYPARNVEDVPRPVRRKKKKKNRTKGLNFELIGAS